jgi:Tol biopolymer transport system component
VIVALAVLIALALVAYVGSRPPLPPPFGLAANGVIAFDAGGRIMAVDVDGNGLHALTSGPGTDSEAAFSPDGTRIGWWHQDGSAVSLMVAKADGQAPTRLLTLTPPGEQFAERPVWSPDSSTIAITVVMRSGSADHPEIWLIDAASGGHSVLLPQSIFGVQYPAFSPDGTRVAFLGEPTHRAEGFLYVANRGGGDLVRVSQRASSDTTGFIGVAQWAPDSPTIAVEFGDSGRLDRDILLLAPDRLDERTLVAGEEDESHPAWSPDGARIAYWRSTVGFLWRLVIRDVASGTELTAGFDDATADSIVWSPDAAFVTVSRCGATTCEILRVDAADPTSAPVVVARLPPKSYEVALDRAYWSWQRLAP